MINRVDVVSQFEMSTRVWFYKMRWVRSELTLATEWPHEYSCSEVSKLWTDYYLHVKCKLREPITQIAREVPTAAIKHGKIFIPLKR